MVFAAEAASSAAIVKSGGSIGVRCGVLGAIAPQKSTTSGTGGTGPKVEDFGAWKALFDQGPPGVRADASGYRLSLR
jgi:hypothetical protein